MLLLVILWVLPHRLVIFQSAQPLAPAGDFFAYVRTPGENSYVMEESLVPKTVAGSRGWRPLKVHGPLDFSLTGVLASIAAPLAEAGISIFALSTFDTDYVLVGDSKVGSAVEVLREAGHEVHEE